MTSEPRDVVLAAFEALGRGEVMALGDLVADDAVWEIMGADGLLPGGARYEGRRAIVENVLPLVPQFYDTSTFDLRAENVFTDGPTVIIEFSLRATCTNGRVNDGARYVWIFRVESGKIVSAREYIDSLKLSRLFFP